jgi:1,4-alpha-glucan branching enzyme
VLDRLGARGRRYLLTFSVTPILAAQLADPRTRTLVDGYLAQRTQSAREARRRHPLARFWIGEYARLKSVWERFDRDLVGTLRRLAESEAIELATSAATHPYLPLTQTRELIRLALATGCDLHRRLFGEEPLGVWMPECAYRPGGPWRHPVTGESEESRPGNEVFLAAQRLGWTVVDAHLLRAGESAFPYGSDLEPEEVIEPGGPHPQPYWIWHSRVAAFLRDARTAAQVWSRQGGYPGDPRYLDFHKRHWPSGLRFWRVTHPEADLGDKLVYWPQDAAEAARAQAEHFVSLVGGMPEMAGGVVVCPFDAELFGHWWFEGPAWLEHVLEIAGEDPLVASTTPARELALYPPHLRARFGEGSWGAGGDHRVWVNPDTDWMWRDLGAAERRAFDAVAANPTADPWQKAVLNQLLLLAASDWPFLVTMQTGRDYAEERFREHRDRLAELLDAGPQAPLPDWVVEDLPFPDLDPAWSAGDET